MRRIRTEPLSRAASAAQLAPQKFDMFKRPFMYTLPLKDGVCVRCRKMKPRVVAALWVGRLARHTATAPVTKGAAIDVPLDKP